MCSFWFSFSHSLHSVSPRRCKTFPIRMALPLSDVTRIKAVALSDFLAMIAVVVLCGSSHI